MLDLILLEKRGASVTTMAHYDIAEYRRRRERTAGRHSRAETFVSPSPCRKSSPSHPRSRVIRRGRYSQVKYLTLISIVRTVK